MVFYSFSLQAGVMDSEYSMVEIKNMSNDIKVIVNRV